MKHIIPAFLLLLSLAMPAMAAEFTILPYPRQGLKSGVDDFVAAVNDMKEIGSTGIVITKTWVDMEPKKRSYDGLHQLGKDFNFNTDDGRHVFFGFQPINTVKRSLPPDLMDKAWDDPDLIGRFQELVDHFSLEGAKPPKYISLANEADVYFETHPKEVEAFLKFYQRASVVAKQAFPSARIGITVTYDGLVKGRGAVIQKLVDASELAIFTYYPMTDLKVQPVENVGENLDAILQVAGEKDLLLQEVGYPSGASLESSPEKQAAFFKHVIGAIQQRDQIKFAGLFMLHDFEPELCDQLVGYYGFEKAPAEPKQRFREFLCTLGVKSFGGAEKPAWKAVKEALK